MTEDKDEMKGLQPLEGEPSAVGGLRLGSSKLKAESSKSMIRRFLEDSKESLRQFEV